jgi:hypothetical protein
VTQSASMDTPRLQVDVAGAGSKMAQTLVHQALDCLLGLDVDLTPFYRLAARSRTLMNWLSDFAACGRHASRRYLRGWLMRSFASNLASKPD